MSKVAALSLASSDGNVALGAFDQFQKHSQIQCEKIGNIFSFFRSFACIKPVLDHALDLFHFPEQTDNLRRYSALSVPTGWKGNYRSICGKISISNPR